VSSGTMAVPHILTARTGLDDDSWSTDVQTLSEGTSGRR
jgi:hypothetical protein